MANGNSKSYYSETNDEELCTPLAQVDIHNLYNPQNMQLALEIYKLNFMIITIVLID